MAVGGKLGAGASIKKIEDRNDEQTHGQSHTELLPYCKSTPHLISLFASAELFAFASFIGYYSLDRQAVMLKEGIDKL